MDSDIIKINCYSRGEVTDETKNILQDFVKYYDGYNVSASVPHDIFVDFTIVDTRVIVNLTDDKRRKDIDVCLVGYCDVASSKDFCAEVKSLVSQFKRKYPNAPIIVVGGYDLTYEPKSVKRAELAGEKMMNRKLGDKLAREAGAVKYVELSIKNGRGYKIVFDEIAIAAIGKFNDDKEQQKKHKCVAF